MNRSERAALARQTVEILADGHYVAPSGHRVDIADDLRLAIDNSQLYRPADFPPEINGCDGQTIASGAKVEVTAETTLEAAHRLATSDGEEPCCLNFASAKNPGGGFLSGSQAQEESLARSSGLHFCLERQMEMYEHNRRLSTSLYSDHMIYSPGVPVFRDDGGQLLETPYKLSFISAPAVNAGAVERNEPEQVPLIDRTMRVRSERLLWVAARHRHRTLVLGAWGCGVFGNDPAKVADLFAGALGEGGKFHNCFERVVYAVYDRSPGQEVLASFKERLTGAGV